MANPEHATKLKEGVDSWNIWRLENPDTDPDLSELDLFKASLSRANLSKVDLNKADLREANIADANLSHSILCSANLNWANLSQADFLGANLTNATLFGSNLRGAKLVSATLEDAYLVGANLSEADLMDANFSRADLRLAKFSDANLLGADFIGANVTALDLSGADLSESCLNGADLSGTNLSGANLEGADLSESKLHKTNLSRAKLPRSNLYAALMIETNLENADLTGCSVYGISAWDLRLKGAKQLDLIITLPGEPIITVDDIEVAQLIYLLLKNERIRNVIDTLGKKAVLILGRFTRERKAVLDALREELRKHDYLPIMFDFEKPSTRNLTETVATLANLSRFVIADITDAKSIPQELQRIVPGLPSVPIQPILLSTQYEYSMFSDFFDYPWVLRPYLYGSLEELLMSLQQNVIAPAVAKAEEIALRRRAYEEEMRK